MPPTKKSSVWGEGTPPAGLSSRQGRQEGDSSGQGTGRKEEGRETEHDIKRRRMEAHSGKTEEKESETMDQGDLWALYAEGTTMGPSTG